jgi:hypothetical protein
MTPAEWKTRFAEVSNEPAHLAANHIHTGDNVSQREGELFDELDSLEMQAAAMIRAGTAGHVT